MILIPGLLILIVVACAAIWFSGWGHSSANTSGQQSSASLSEPQKQLVREARQSAALLRESLTTSSYEGALKQFKILNNGLDEIPGDDAQDLRKYGSEKVAEKCESFGYANHALDRSLDLEANDDDATYEKVHKAELDALGSALGYCYVYDDACKQLLEGKKIVFKEEILKETAGK
jgi:hypothetical protein